MSDPARRTAPENAPAISETSTQGLPLASGHQMAHADPAFLPLSYGQSLFVYVPSQNFTPSAPVKQPRPIGVTIIALWHLVLGGLIPLVSLVSFKSTVGAMPGDHSLMGPIILLMVLMVPIGGVCLLLFVGKALWQLVDSGRSLAIFVQGLNSLLSVAVLASLNSSGLLYIPEVWMYINLAVSVAILGYLYQPDVRTRFSAPH